MPPRDDAPTIDVVPLRAGTRFAVVRIAWAWTLGIFLLCWIPREGLPADETGPGFLKIPHLDKVIHATLFAGFAALWRLSGMTGRRVLLFAAAAALISELGQLLPIVNRDFGADDLAADLLGVVLGLAIVHLWAPFPRELAEPSA